MKHTRREFVRTLFVATQATVIGSLIPPNLFAADAKSASLNFLALGDWGRNGEKDQTNVATQMAAAAKEMDAKFILALGDNFYEHGVKSVDDPHWQNSFEKVYTAASLQVPWHVLLGNHDYHGDCEAQIAYSKTSQRWNMPARYYTRTEKIDADHTVEFFFLDTTPMAERRDDILVSKAELGKTDKVAVQLAWFESALDASKAQWKIVLGHHPVYSGGEHGSTPYIVKHILPLLEKHGVQAYFNGHDHDLQHLLAGKVNLFCTGAGSKPRATTKTAHTRFAEGCSGFTAVALHPDFMQVRMINDQGRLLYVVNIPQKAA